MAMNLTLSVVGCGYLGATHAACMSSLGFTVIGIDTDPEKVALLSRGELPFYEPGLDTLLAQEIKTGRLTFTTDFSAVCTDFVCSFALATVKKPSAAVITTKTIIFMIIPKVKLKH